MKMYMIAVKDLAVSAFMQPSFVAHTGAAVRAFTDHCRDEQSAFAKHPEDYELYLLGEFDDQNGGFNVPESPERLMRALDCLVTKN